MLLLRLPGPTLPPPFYRKKRVFYFPCFLNELSPSTISRELWYIRDPLPKKQARWFVPRSRIAGHVDWKCAFQKDLLSTIGGRQNPLSQPSRRKFGLDSGSFGRNRGVSAKFEAPWTGFGPTSAKLGPKSVPPRLWWVSGRCEPVHARRATSCVIPHDPIRSRPHPSCLANHQQQPPRSPPSDNCTRNAEEVLQRKAAGVANKNVWHMLAR